MTKDEALKLALEALETGLCYVENEDFDNKQKFRGYEHLMPTDAAESIQEIKTAITAIKEALAQPEQEPVAWLHTKIEGVAVPHRPADLDKHPDRWEALYKAPPPCPTCEALARTVMLDQTSHDTTPPQRQPLTDEQVRDIAKQYALSLALPYDSKTTPEMFARAIEAAHNIKGE